MADKNKKRDNQPPKLIVATFSFDPKPVGPFLMTTIELKRSNNPVAGANVVLTKIVGAALTWEQPLTSNGDGRCTFFVPLGAGENLVVLTAQVAVGTMPVQNFSDKWERATTPKTVTAITATCSFKTSPVTVNVNTTLADPTKLGRVKLVSNANINATIIGGSEVCSNAREGTFDVIANIKTQIRVTLPAGVRSASIYLEADGNATVRSQVINIHAQN